MDGAAAGGRFHARGNLLDRVRARKAALESCCEKDQVRSIGLCET